MIERRCAEGFIVLLITASCAAINSGRRGGWSEAEVETLPPEVRASYSIFAARCSRCHTLSRPLGAGIADPEHWERYVARMRRMPGAGISGPDAEQILVFLIHHARGVAEQRSKGAWLAPRLGSPLEETP